MSIFLNQLFKPKSAFAQVFGDIKAPPGVDKYGGNPGEGLFILLNNLMKLIIVVAGLYALLNFILAGFEFISAGGNSEKVSKAWAKIWMSLVGLLVAAGSFTLAAVFGKIIFGSYDAILIPKIYGP